MDPFASAFGKPQASISKESLVEKITNKIGEDIELTSNGMVPPGELSLQIMLHQSPFL